MYKCWLFFNIIHNLNWKTNKEWILLNSWCAISIPDDIFVFFFIKTNNWSFKKYIFLWTYLSWIDCALSDSKPIWKSLAAFLVSMVTIGLLDLKIYCKIWFVISHLYDRGVKINVTKYLIIRALIENVLCSLLKLMGIRTYGCNSGSMNINQI